MLNVLDLAGYQPFNLMGALDQLHGTTKSLMKEDGSAVTNKEGQIVTDTVPHTFGAGLRLQLALLRKKLSSLVEAFQTEHMALIKALPKDANGMPAPADHEKFQADLKQMLACELDISMKPIDVKLLNIDENKLSPELVIRLMPILDSTTLGAE